MDGMNNMPNNQQMSNNQQMQYNQQMPNYQQMPGGMMPKGPNNSGKIIALILGIVSISVGFLGGILFGIFGALIGIACGVVGLLPAGTAGSLPMAGPGAWPQSGHAGRRGFQGWAQPTTWTSSLTRPPSTVALTSA